MNKSLIYLLFFLSLFALSACSDAERFDTEQQQPSSRQALTLSVCASDFATYSDGALDTRATNSGTTTTFAEGDRVGVIITDGDNNLWADNIPYTYSKTEKETTSSWVFDTANGEGKTPYYYDNKATGVTYIVYYPYSPEANGITTADDLKRKFPPLSNQSTEADYDASDLLLCEQKSTVPLKTLSAELAHAYASVSFVSKVLYTLADRANTAVDVYPSISDVSFSINGDIFVAHKATDGSYCCIFPASDSGVDIRYFYTDINGTFSAALNASPVATAANTRYTSTLTTANSAYTFADARTGDFYCKDKDGVIGNAYLIPGDITTELTPDQKAACLGIVLKVDRDDSGDWKDDCKYKQKDGTTPMTTIHGYVLALHDANDGNTCTWGSSGTEVDHTDMNREQNTGFYGYKNTNAIKAFVTNDMTLETAFPATYHATEGYEAAHPAPANSSGWFLPSAGQGKYWLDNKDAILASVNKATSESYSWLDYWSSSEGVDDPANDAWVVNFDSGYVDYGYKYNGILVRSVFAF